jgi:hypothetical protein
MELTCFIIKPPEMGDVVCARPKWPFLPTVPLPNPSEVTKYLSMTYKSANPGIYAGTVMVIAWMVVWPSIRVI